MRLGSRHVTSIFPRGLFLASVAQANFGDGESADAVDDDGSDFIAGGGAYNALQQGGAVLGLGYEQPDHAAAACDGSEAAAAGAGGGGGAGAGLGDAAAGSGEPEPVGPDPNEPLSGTVLLRNIFDPAADPATIQDIKDEICLECQKLGKTLGYHCHSDGSVQIQYESPYVAARCVAIMHGRFFDERNIVADYVIEPAAMKARGVSRAVLLRRVFDPGEHPPGSPHLENLRDEFGQEGSRLGPVFDVEVRHKDGAICIVFESTVSAVDCVKVMHGRWFDERQIQADYDLEHEESTVTVAETVDVEAAYDQLDDAAKLDKFMSMVGDF
jgi:hypothetical protein